MGSVISVTNMKGGVGKTTLTANLGHCLSKIHKKKVLLIDVDPQFNLTQYCMGEDEYVDLINDSKKGTIYDLFIPESSAVPRLLGKKSIKKKIFEHKIAERLFLIPSTIDLIDFIDQRRSGSERLLTNYISKIKDNYDFIFIDCPPTSTILSRASYLASDKYLIPIGMDYFSVMGIPLLQKDIEDFMNTYGKELVGLGIIRTRYLDWTKVAQRLKKTVNTFADNLKLKVFESALKQRQDIQNALSERKFILDYNSSCDSAKDIQKITSEFLTLIES